MSVHSPKLIDVPRALRHEDLIHASESEIMDMMEASERTQKTAELHVSDIRRKGATEGRFVPRSVLLHFEGVVSVCKQNRQVLQRVKGEKKRARLGLIEGQDYFRKCGELMEQVAALKLENDLFRKTASVAGFSSAFVDVARIVLAEATFKMIEDRAKDRCGHAVGSAEPTKVRP